MPDESLRHENAVDIGAVADVEQHVGDAGGRRLFKGRQHAPDAVDLLLHLLLLDPHQIPFLGRSVHIELRSIVRGVG